MHPSGHGAAIIDIGSNSIRYKGADGRKRLITTRLAEGLSETGRLSRAAMERSFLALGEFARLAACEGLRPFAYATSAVRDASNGRAFALRIASKLGIAVEILPGDLEARYAWLGATGGEGALLDIGGGSCQLVDGEFSLSFPIGCVRARERFRSLEGGLDALRAALQAQCATIFAFPKPTPSAWTGVGGTVTTLAALKLGLCEYDGDRVNACTLTPGDVDALIAALCAMGEMRKAHPLLRERHDVIVYGAMLLSFIMRGLDLDCLRVSDADGMEGYREHILQSLPVAVKHK